MKRIANCAEWLLLMLLFAACNRTSTLDLDRLPGRRVSIAYLKSLCEGSRFAVTHQIFISGRVTGNNRYGEFPYEIILEDESGGIAIAVDYPAYGNLYPLGCELTVFCNGLTLYDYGGKVGLCKPSDETSSWGEAPSRRIPEEELARYLRLTDAALCRPAAHPIAPDALSPALADTYIRIDGVRLAEKGSWCDRDPETGRPRTTERRLADAAGNPLPLKLRTAGSVLYADEPLPEGCGSLCGILDYFGGAYSLRITAFETFFVRAPATPATACP